MNDDYKDLLIKKYRIPLFGTYCKDILEINDLISDEELVSIIEINNNEMIKLINEDNIDVNKLRPLFMANMNFYRLANYRDMSVHGKSIMMSVATALNYDLNKVIKIFNNNLYKTLRSK